jgi:hypothetical protein
MVEVKNAQYYIVVLSNFYLSNGELSRLLFFKCGNHNILWLAPKLEKCTILASICRIAKIQICRCYLQFVGFY